MTSMRGARVFQVPVTLNVKIGVSTIECDWFLEILSQVLPILDSFWLRSGYAASSINDMYLKGAIKEILGSNLSIAVNHVSTTIRSPQIMFDS